MKLASYIGTQSGIRGLGNILIRLRLSGIKEALRLKPYGGMTLRASHSEIVFEPSDSVDYLMPDRTTRPDSEGRLWCISSTGTDILPAWSKHRAGKMGGVRFKRINVSNPDKWVLQDIPSIDPRLVADFACKHEGALYDWQAVLGFVAKFIHEKEGRWMCSEFVAEALNIPDAAKQDPCSLQLIIHEIGKKNVQEDLYLIRQMLRDIANTNQFFQGKHKD